MDYKKSYLLFQICLFAGLILCVVSLGINRVWPGILGVVLFILGILQAAIFYRCPKCGKSLNFREKRAKYCPECGEKLD